MRRSWLRQGLLWPCLVLLATSVPVRATPAEGTILFNWKIALGNPDKLTNWVDQTDPCGSNPWFYVNCNGDGFVQRIDLGSSDLSGPLAPDLGQLSQLQTLTLYSNGFNGTIPAELGNLLTLNFLDLSNNNLSGIIPPSFGNLSSLTTLKLSNNNLDGPIPVELTKLSKLTDFEVSHNNLSGRVYTNASWSGEAETNFGGNSQLCGAPVGIACPGDPPLPSPSLSSVSIGAIVGGVAAGIIALLCIIGGYIYWRRRHPKEAFFDVPAQEESEVNLGQLKRFSLSQLRIATENFSARNEIGRGGFGRVYKGVLSDGTAVAVKRLKEDHNLGNEQQFQTEVEIISMAAHRNLLRLYGFCTTPNERLLVYPFMSNGSVSSQLQLKKPNGEPALNSKMRKHIALGAAKGLAYLHEQCNPKIIHRDVKADNILLDDEFEAVVGDFGLAKPVDFKNTHITTAVRGTLGHIAPEYMSTGKSSEKTDVYGYGITLLQLITGQGAVNLSRLSDNDDVMLLDWVKKLVREDRVEVMVDPNLKEYDIEDIKELLRVALLCTQNSPAARPKMSEVVLMLEGNGLEERWAEWEKLEVLRNQETLHLPRLPPGWNLDSHSSFMQALELSGPR